ncbi:glycosyltransferase [Spirosoma flavus]
MKPQLNVLPVRLARQFGLFDHHPPDNQLRISVIIPARNEADNLEQALDGLRNQRQLDGNLLPARRYEVLLLLNNCTDGSEQVARDYQRRYPAFSLYVSSIQLPPEKANVGTARRLLMDEACKRLRQVGRPQGIIASTDGDTIVDPCWLAHTQAEIAQGCDAVGGRILTRPDLSRVRVNHLRNVTYRMLIAQLEASLDPLAFDPWPRHFQHFGASLALTCAAYERVGGLPDVANLEDEALYRALIRMDSRVRQSPHVRVTTSTRLEGRVDIGFSEQLRYWDCLNRSHQCQLVEPAAAIIHRIQARRLLREIWQNQTNSQSVATIQEIADTLLLNVEWLHDRLEQSCHFGQLWEQVEAKLIVGTWVSLWKAVPITEAISQLREFVNQTESRVYVAGNQSIL